MVTVSCLQEPLFFLVGPKPYSFRAINLLILGPKTKNILNLLRLEHIFEKEKGRA